MLMSKWSICAGLLITDYVGFWMIGILYGSWQTLNLVVYNGDGFASKTPSSKYMQGLQRWLIYWPILFALHQATRMLEWSAIHGWSPIHVDAPTVLPIYMLTKVATFWWLAAKDAQGAWCLFINILLPAYCEWSGSVYQLVVLPVQKWMQVSSEMALHYLNLFITWTSWIVKGNLIQLACQAI